LQRNQQDGALRLLQTIESKSFPDRHFWHGGYDKANQVAADALPTMIQSVYRSLVSVDSPEPASVEPPTPAVPIKRSVFPDFIICLEDGKKLKMLKRHLKTSYNLTPADYRARWGLPLDYPMVAPNYAIHRSTLAKNIGLGKKRVAVVSEPEATQRDEPEVTIVPARRARGSKG